MEKETPETPMQETPQAPTPAGKSSSLPLIALAVVVALVVGGGVGYLMGSRSTSSPKASPPLAETPKTQESTTSSQPATSDPTADWKTYTGETQYSSDGSTMFSLKYPSSWKLVGSKLYPFGQSGDEGSDTKLLMGLGGRGLEVTPERKTYPAGVAKYWKLGNDQNTSLLASFDANNASYIFEFQNIPAESSEKLTEIFDQILSTFQFLD
ncbi:MAG: hypothetical protein ABH814_02360 [bacterium]